MITARPQRSKHWRRALPAVAAIGISALLLTGCSGGGAGAGAGGKGSAKFQYVGSSTNTVIGESLKTLAAGACKAENSKQPLTTSSTPGDSTLDQHLQLLAGQNALPTFGTGSGTPSLMKQFIKADKLVDLTKALGSDASNIQPAALSTLQNLYGTQDAYAFPTELNVEGIWYNKKIFAANGITEPSTWDELVSDSQKLVSANVQPIAGDGKDGWPITRFISGYLFRDLGPDALKSVANGKAKLTDSEYVKAATAVAALGKTGAFGKSPSSIDYNTMESLFLTGKAAMMYNGSWTIGNFTDKKQNTIGIDNIGFMPFPAVTGGKGSIDQYPANVGIPMMASQKQYGSNTQAWLKCMAKNYGNVSLAAGVISGMKSTETPADLNALTKDVQTKINATKTTVLWFEALMGAKQTNVSVTNVSSLVTGSLSPEKFMSLVQAAQGS